MAIAAPLRNGQMGKPSGHCYFEDLFVLKVVIGSELIRERFVCCG